MMPQTTTLKKQTGRLTSFAVSAFIGLSLSACAFSENPGAGTPSPVKTGDVLDTLQNEKDKEVASGKLTIENVSVTFEENPSPASYRMVVRWPKSIQHVTISVNSKLPVVVRNADFAEFAVLSDTEYHVQIIAYGNVSSSPLSSVELTAKSPLDLLIREHMELATHTVLRVRRIFFFKSGRIVTNGKSLTVEAEKLYAESKTDAEMKVVKDGKSLLSKAKAFESRSHIVTNARDTVATSEADLAGANIAIEAKEAHGHLFVAMIGVNGRKGLSGLEREPTMKPRPSRDVPTDKLLNGTDGVETMVGTKCRIGLSGEVSGCGQSLGCTTAPTSGRAGKNGDPGTQGGRGESRGGYGRLVFSIEDSRNLTVNVGIMNGKPGEGGEGAPGFPGVQGGAPGAQPGTCSAFEVSKGKNGEAGPLGDKGDKGDETRGGTVVGGGARIIIDDLSDEPEAEKAAEDSPAK